MFNKLILQRRRRSTITASRPVCKPWPTFIKPGLATMRHFMTVDCVCVWEREVWITRGILHSTILSRTYLAVFTRVQYINPKYVLINKKANLHCKHQRTVVAINIILNKSLLNRPWGNDYCFHKTNTHAKWSHNYVRYIPSNLMWRSIACITVS